MQRTLAWLALVFTFALPSLASAQTCPAGRYCFYVPPGIPLDASHSTAASRVFDVILSAPTRVVSGTYVVDGGTSTPFTVTPGTSFRIPLTGGAGLAPGYNTPANRGVFIVGNRQDMTVDFRETFSAEQYSATIQRSTLSLGTRFRLAGYSLNVESVARANRDIAIVYAPTGATVTFTRPPGGAANFWDETPADTDGTLTVTIPAGQTVAVRTSGGFDFDGALVTSTAPIGVVSGGRGWSSAGCGDDGMDGVLPTSIWGTQFAVRYPTGTNLTDSRVRVLADTNGTQVFLDGGAVAAATLNAGEFFTFAATTTRSVRTSQPAMVWISAGQNGCELDTAYIPPLTFVASVSSLGLDFNVLGGGQMTLLLPDGSESSVRLDGAAAAPTFVINELIPGVTGVRIVRFDVAAGDRRVVAATDFQAMLASRTSPSGLLAYYNPFRLPGCGDGEIDAPETCDDNNGDDGDGCSSTCRIEPGWTCAPGEPSVCTSRCGDGAIARPVESCDDGNTVSGDRCSATCRLEVVISVPAEASTTTDATPTISGTADAGAMITVTVGGMMLSTTADALGSWSVTVPSALPDGPTSVTATARATDGGTSTDTNAFTVDATTFVAITMPTEGASTSSTPTLTGTAEPGASVVVSIDGTSIGTVTVGSDGTWMIASPALAGGMHTATATATDASGNTASATPVGFVVDATTNVAIVSPDEGATTMDATPTVSGTGEAGATVVVALVGPGGAMAMATTTVAADGTWSFTPSTLANGMWTATAVATDVFGNSATDTQSFIVNADASITITSPADGTSTNDATPTISGTADPGASVTVTVGGMTLGPVTAAADGTWSVTVPSALSEGTQTATATSTTVDGRMAMDTSTFTVDTSTRVAFLQPGDAGPIGDTTPELSGTGEPGASVAVSIDGTSVGTVTVDAAGNWTFQVTSALGNGAHDVSVTATDTAGNTATDTGTFTIDTSFPALEIDSPADGATTGPSPIISGRTDPSRSVTVIIDGRIVGVATANPDGLWTLPLTTALSAGDHTVEATTTDAAGNTARDRHRFTVDATAPSVSITSPANGERTADSTPSIRGMAEAGASVQVFVGGVLVGTVTAGADGTWSIDVTSPLSDGDHTVRAVATDATGNTATASGAFVVDTATFVVIARPANESTLGALRPTYTGTGEPGATITVLVDGTEIGTTVVAPDGTWSFAQPSDLTAGVHTVTADAEDALGNTATASNDFTVDPSMLDSDGDGILDTVECPTAGSCPDTDGDGDPDQLDPDDDGDGVPTAIECPTPASCRDTDGDGTVDYLDPDDDGDGIPTRDERPGDVSIDTDGDGAPNYLDPDDDGDGLPTMEECAVAGSCRDTDTDGTDDYLDPDDDGDGILTSRERADGAMFGDDVDGDGLPNWLDTNSDGDAFLDADEGLVDTDMMGPPDYLDPNEPMTMGDAGVLDGSVPDGSVLDGSVADAGTLTTPGGLTGGACGCSAVGRASPSRTIVLLLLGLGLVLARRRTR